MVCLAVKEDVHVYVLKILLNYSFPIFLISWGRVKNMETEKAQLILHVWRLGDLTEISKYRENTGRAAYSHQTLRNYTKSLNNLVHDDVW